MMKTGSVASVSGSHWRETFIYTRQGDTIFFASEIETLLANSGVKPVLDRKGLNEVFSIGPAKTYAAVYLKGLMRYFRDTC